MDKVKVGILDDDASKISSIRVKLLKGVKDGSEGKLSKYSNIELMPLEIPLKENNTIDKIIEFIYENEIDAILLDYKLNSFHNINFSGVDVAKRILEVKEEFPLFILTSFEDDLFNTEVFDPYRVIDYGRYVNDASERIEVNFKIIELLINLDKKINSYEEKLIELLPKKGESSKIDSEILELDSKIERLLNKQSSIPHKIKEDLSSNHLTDLIKKLDWIIENE